MLPVSGPTKLKTRMPQSDYRSRIHLVVAADRLNLKSGMILRTSTSVLFVIPNGDHWVIGTTDSEWKLNKAHPAATKCDIRYLLQTINSVIASPLSEEDVIGVYAGLRPLRTGESDTTSQLSREHAVTHPAPGLVSISGGKYTTYRVWLQKRLTQWEWTKTGNSALQNRKSPSHRGQWL